MGWFWKSKDGGGGPSDPLANLDPNLRAFLLKESPLKPSPPASSRSSAKAPTPTTPSPETSSPPAPSEEEGGGANPRTRHSKYGDRYADIWEQYTPQGVTEASKSSQEQLADILQAYKYRKTLIGRAALENCSSEQYALLDCYHNSGIVKRMMACTSENRKLQDCYFTQTKFLQAMGYMSDFSRSPETDEKIQMHSDKLYQERLRQDEAAAAEKKAKRAQPETMAPES